MKLIKGFIILPVVLFGTLILLSVFVLAIGNKTQVDTNRKLPTPTVLKNFQNNLVHLTGMVWTSGLTDQEKRILKIDSDYQIEKAMISEGWEDKINGMFLLTEGAINFSSYLGKCATVKGTVKNGWENLIKNNYEINGVWTYNRSAIVVNEIDTNDINLCIGKYDKTIKDQKKLKGLEYKTAKGILGFSKRPAPDISYDFELTLDEPFVDKQNATGNPVTTDRLDISPGSDNIYKQIIINIGKNVEIGGYMEWEYAESRYLMVDKVIIR